MPRLPLWFVLRGLVWIAVLIWILVMVGKQFVRNFQWRTDWQTGVGALVTVFVTVPVAMWLYRQIGKLVEKAEVGDKNK